LDDGLYIALLNPSIGFVLATAFLVLWLHLRQRAHIAMLAVGYAASSVGFLLQYFVLPIGLTATKFTSNVLFFAAGLCIASGVIGRYGRPLPLLALGLLAAGGLGSLSWFLFVEPDLTWRIYAINFTLGGISLVVAAELRAVPDKTPVDWVLYAVSLLSGLNFFARTLIVIHTYGVYESYQGFYGSIYWTTVILSHAILSIVIALTLITGTALDLIEDLRSESQTDPLSRLLNRRGLEEQASRMLADTGHHALPVSLVLCDLDHFKAVNDSLGHVSGDLVISAFAGLLRKAAVGRYVAGRIGGEEFAIVLPDANLFAARLFAEGVRSAFAALPIDGLPEGRRFTASFGVAERSRNESIAELLARADTALYAAKNEGRDCVRVAEGRLARRSRRAS